MRMPDPVQMLAADGALSHLIEGFSPRSQQQAMAEAVKRAIDGYEVLICEAGTGTGKTLAYLCPLLASGRKAIVSTGTKNLQEQLYRRDLPLAAKALQAPVRIALLKGRSNYLCQHRLGVSHHQPSLDPVEQDELARVEQWAGWTQTGDIAECTEVSENALVWPKVTSTVENCLGTQCEFFDECYVLRARRDAIEADVVVVNHHLFFADMVLREEGFGELLPGAQAVVFDEAHQLPEIATRFFGVSLSTTQLRELCRDTLAAYHTEAGDLPELPERVAAVEKSIADLRLCLGAKSKRLAWVEISASVKVQDRVDELKFSLTGLADGLEVVAERGQALASCEKRCASVIERIDLLSLTTESDSVRWLELSAHGFIWHLSPLEVSGAFSARVLAQQCAWVFTSATLAIGDSVEHFADRLGLTGYASEIWDSPFDYRHQGLCFVPQTLPEPRDPAYGIGVLEASIPVLEASRGRAFMLFTSHAALTQASVYLNDRIEFPLLVQGRAPRDELLRQFRTTANAVLLGTSSFWQGVDVRGEALSCVIIDKLPFAAPDDPLLQARLHALRRQGKEPFISYQLPQAVISLKQGAGRLIRDEGDCGVLMLCDPRLLSKSYGRVFLESLPPMPVTRDIDEVRAFLATI